MEREGCLEQYGVLDFGERNVELLTPQLADFRRGQSESLVRAQSPPRNISEIRNSLKLDRAGLSDRAISFLKGKSTAHAKTKPASKPVSKPIPMELDHPAPGEPSVRSAAGSCRASEARASGRVRAKPETKERRRFSVFAFALGHNLEFASKYMFLNILRCFLSFSKKKTMYDHEIIPKSYL